MIDPQTKRRYELALICLDRGLHPNTGDGEVLACVEAWRRKVLGDTFRDVISALFDDRTVIGMTLSQYEQDWKDKFQIQREQLAHLMDENIRCEQELEKTRQIIADLELQLTLGKIKWSKAEWDFMIKTHLADRTIMYLELAEICTKEFGREITKHSISGALSRARKKGVIPMGRSYKPRRKHNAV